MTIQRTSLLWCTFFVLACLGTYHMHILHIFFHIETPAEDKITIMPLNNSTKCTLYKVYRNITLI